MFYVCFKEKIIEHFICDAPYSYKIWNALCRRKKNITNPKKYNSISQVMGLLSKDHQFESRKPQGH